ncbi:tyrosine-type recombinase/integrase [Streptomyces rimosus]|uniref:tyrosine-type recombinase/integrase n=1 Tax=Streptomyces rimosus TaxID=1927 RepID=UPI00067C5F20|nr:tyrosine-type recombinase/integrase [Streptomyces rimosus]
MDTTVPVKKKAARAVAEWLGSKGEGTRKEYQRDIDRYVEYCVGRGVNPLKAKPDNVRGFLDVLRVEYRLKARTRLRAYKALSSFYSYAADWDFLKKGRPNPMRYVDPPKIDDDEPRLGMTMEEAVAFLREAFFTSTRLYALVTTLLLLGLRISELLTADIEDIGIVHGQRVLWVQRKGKQSKTAMPLPDMAFAALVVYIGDRRSGPIFITRTGRRLNRHGAYDTITRLARRAGVPHVHPHLIRATTTTLLLGLGQALERVQVVMGHSDPKTTIAYNKVLERLLYSPIHVLEIALKGRVDESPLPALSRDFNAAVHRDPGELRLLLDTAA